MDATVFSERKVQQIAPLIQAAADLGAMAGKPATSTEDRSTLRNAAVRLRVAADQIAKLADGLQPYSEPAFYAELAPSLAKDDQGKHASNALESVFSE